MNKNIKFTYYQVCCVVNESEEKLYDLRSWFSEIGSHGLKERRRDLNGVLGRVEKIIPLRECYSINFMRLDDISNTYKVKENKEAEHIDLDDDEYIGKNTVLLYDPDNYILMIQANRGGYNVGAIENYITETLSTEGIMVCLRPILSNLDDGRCLKENIKKIDVRFANIKDCRPSNSIDLENIIDACNNLECVTVHLEIGLGRSRIDTMDNKRAHNIVKDIKENEDCISSAKIRLKNNLESALIDIFEDVVHDFISFQVKERKELAFEQVAHEMYAKYTSIGRSKIIQAMN